MTIEDIKQGESEVLEFKREFPDKERKVLKTIVAFANGNGGNVVIGVDDETLKIVGVNEDEVFKIKDKISNSISDNISPQIIPRISFERIEDKTLIIINIAKGQNTPYCIKSEGLEGVYIRVDATTRVAERYKVQELSLLGMNKTFDEIVQNGTKEAEYKDIDFLIKAFSSRSKRQVTIQNFVSWKLLSEENGKYYPSVAFRLLTNNDIHFARIQCGLFKGTDKVHFLDRKEFDGSVLEQIENAITFLIQHLNIGAEIKGLFRKDIYEIPEEILRELVTNAVMHRNYLLSSYIQICIFDDRIEIVSPGGIFGGLTIQDILEGRSSVRNEVLADAFLKMQLVEHWGTGLKRIREICVENDIEEPSYTATSSFFTATVKRKSFKQKDTLANDGQTSEQLSLLDKMSNKMSNKEQDRIKIIAEYLLQNFLIQKSEAAKLLNVEDKTAQRLLTKAVDLGILESNGEYKSTTYKLNDNL